MSVAIRIGAGDKVLVVGQTGTGKSTVASALANAWPRVLVLDPKMDDAVAELPNARIAYGVGAALTALPGRVVYRPLPSEMDAHDSRLARRGACRCLPCSFDVLVRAAYMLGSHGIVLHETEIVAPDTGARRWLRSAIMWGRSRRVPMIFCAQRPARIDRLCLSEPAHVYLFRLNDERDLSTISGVFGVKSSALRPLGHPHAFYYRGPTGDVHAMAPLSIRAR